MDPGEILKWEHEEAYYSLFRSSSFPGRASSDGHHVFYFNAPLKFLQWFPQDCTHTGILETAQFSIALCLTKWPGHWPPNIGAKSMQISPLSSFVLTFYQSGGLPNMMLSVHLMTVIHKRSNFLLASWEWFTRHLQDTVQVMAESGNSSYSFKVSARGEAKMTRL